MANETSEVTYGQQNVSSCCVIGTLHIADSLVQHTTYRYVPDYHVMYDFFLFSLNKIEQLLL